MISLERKRTERSRRPFLLTLLDVSAVLTGDQGSKKVGNILSTLSFSIRETDIMGWYKGSSVIGIVFNEIPLGPGKAVVNAILTRVKGMLYRALSFEDFNRISISYHLFPEKWNHDVPQRPSHPTLYPDVSRRDTVRTFFSILKRVMDVIGSVLGLVLCAPVFLVIAAAIRLTSPGPVFFRQQRVGLYGTPFVFLKFRTMHMGNDTHVHKEYVKQLIAGQAKPQPRMATAACTS